MSLSDFSFLYLSKDGKTSGERSGISSLLEDLGLGHLLHSSTVDITRFITDDHELISYRSVLFADFIECDGLFDLFSQIRGILSDIHEINRASNAAETNETNLYSIKQLELYINFIKLAHDGFESLRDRIKSPQLLQFADIIAVVHGSEDFTALCTGTEKMLLSVANIKSVTVGFNLNAQMEPYEGGLLSVNTEYVRSGNLVDRLLSANVKRDELTALCPLIPSSKAYKKQEYDTASAVFMEAMKKTLRLGIGKWQSIVKNFLTGAMTDYIALLPEIDYMIYGASVIRELKARGLPLCRPVLHPKEDGICRITGFYNPVTALTDPDVHQIKNDFTFDKDGTIYICTGPNGGGKSVFTRAIGIIYLFCQMGLPVPAKSAELSPVDMIRTVFPNKAFGLSSAGGRLDEECIEIRSLFSEITPHSLVLLDEALSSTGAFEGALIARELICALKQIGVKAIFTTHMHELVGMVDEMNADFGGGIDTVTTEVADGRRTFRISRRRPDGKSYAMDIAEKYGISGKRLTELNAARKNGGES